MCAVERNVYVNKWQTRQQTMWNMKKAMQMHTKQWLKKGQKSK